MVMIVLPVDASGEAVVKGGALAALVLLGYAEYYGG